METETKPQTTLTSNDTNPETATLTVTTINPQTTASSSNTSIINEINEDPTNDTTDETITNLAEPQTEEKVQKEQDALLTHTANPPSTAPSVTSPIVANHMNSINPMLMPPIMSAMPAINGMNGMNPPPMMPGFAPYPMFGAPTMLPFMPGLNPNAITTANNTNKTKTGKRCGDWQSYITEKGKTYYYNVVTKVNTWDKPKKWMADEVQTHPQETKPDSDATQATNTSASASVTPPEASMEAAHKNKKDGYLGTAATKELAVIKDNVAKRSFGREIKTKYKDRSERVNAFRALLKDKQIEAEWIWKKVLPKIVTDKRYNALTKLDDKKNELVLWQQDEKKRIQNEEREKRHQLKSGYFELLDEFIDKIIRKEYRKAKHYLESDDRFVEISSKHRREEWFDEWQNARYKEYKKERKKKKEMAIKELAERLKCCELLKIDSEWQEIRTKVSFVSEPFMELLSQRNQEKIFNEIMDELIEKDKEEKRRKLKQDKKRFAELMDELIAKKLIHTKYRYDDQDVVQLMANDERYKEMNQHSHDLKSIFNQKIDELKDKLKDDKKIFKQFMRNKELMVGIKDSWTDILPQFKKLSENHSISNKLNENHMEHLLAAYVYKKQKELKAQNNNKNLNEKEVIDSVVVNSKKRDRNDIEHKEEDEPLKKRQKIDKKYVDVTIHDPASYKQKKEDAMDEGEIEELEEGELSDVEIKSNNKEDEDKDEKMDTNHRNGHCNKRSDSLSSQYSVSLSASPHSAKASDISSNDGLRSRSRSRSRSSNYSLDSNALTRKSSKKRHKKSGKRHKNHRKYDRNHRHHRDDKKRREHKKHNRDHKGNKKKHRERKRERERQREKEKESPRVKYSNIDNILYGITSDIDEEDLYYRGDIKRSDQISYDHEDEIHHEEINAPHNNNNNNNNGNNSNNNQNINNHKRNQRGGLSHWNNNARRHQSHHHHHHHYNKHHDLDYNNSYALNDHEINADSYNLDNDEMARWNQ